MERRARRDMLQTRLGRAQLAIEADLSNPAHQEELSTITELLNSLNSKQALWVDQVLQARWVSEGEKGSKLFFKSFQSMASSKHIPVMLAADGSSLTSWDEMAVHAVNFFSNVLGRGPLETPSRPSLAQ